VAFAVAAVKLIALPVTANLLILSADLFSSEQEGELISVTTVAIDTVLYLCVCP